MRPNTLIATLTARAQAQFTGKPVRPAYVVGPPGGGKTQIAKQVAKNLGCGFRTLHVPLMQPEDFGMPRFSGDEITFATPGHLFPFVDSDCEDTGVLVMEEMGQGENAQQKILANMMQERELHGRKLKPGWYIAATGNRQSDRAGANRILSHLNDRITTYELEASLDDWCEWALHNNVRPEVISFLRWRPDLLAKFDPTHDKSPTPRSWSEGVSASIDTVPREAEFDTYTGDVGEGAASEFVGFIQIYRDLPDPDLVLANPGTATIPNEMSIRYALCGALANRLTVDLSDNYVAFAERLHHAGLSEFMMLMMRDGAQMCKGFDETRAFNKWAVGLGSQVITGSGR